MELNLWWHPTTMLRSPRSSCKPWKCRSWKMKTTLILYSKCVELCKPIHPKPMSAHHANLVLCWQTYVSPTLITYLNHQKILQRYPMQWHKFSPRSHNSMHEKQVQFYNMLHHSHKSFLFPMIFSLRSKATVTTTSNQVLRGKRMWMMV
jgi:hypothetical protein